MACPLALRPPRRCQLFLSRATGPHDWLPEALQETHGKFKALVKILQPELKTLSLPPVKRSPCSGQSTMETMPRLCALWTLKSKTSSGSE